MFILLAALLSCAPQADEPMRAGVARLVDQHFPSPDPALRGQWTDRITRSIGTVSDPSVHQALVKELPSAFVYHASYSLQYRMLGKGFPVPEDLLREGYPLQIDYLEARIDRVARTPWSLEREQAIAGQIEVLCTSAKEILKERLQGPVADKLVNEQVENLRSAWKDSLTTPLSRFVDAPLTATQLESVIGDMRSKVAARTPIELTPEDAADPKRLEKLGVGQALFDVQEAAFGACAVCYEALLPAEDRVLEWYKRFNGAMDAALALRGPLPGQEARPEPSSANRPRAKRPKSPPAKAAAPQETSERVPAPRAAAPESPSPSRRAAVAAVIAVLLVVVAIFVLRRRPA